MTPLIDWDSPRWGLAGSNTHEASWAPDSKHEDETEEETC